MKDGGAMAKREFTCGLNAALAMIGGKWRFLILWHLAHQPRRFGELRRQVEGISEKMLIQELKALIQNELVSRKDFHEVPPRVEYSLTKFGRSLATATVPLCDWGAQHMKRIGAMSGIQRRTQ
jgi:DNA-binding HxlR family transcriptional regulator